MKRAKPVEVRSMEGLGFTFNALPTFEFEKQRMKDQLIQISIFTAPKALARCCIPTSCPVLVKKAIGP